MTYHREEGTNDKLRPYICEDARLDTSYEAARGGEKKGRKKLPFFYPESPMHVQKEQHRE
jgi:hypothetical protein